MLKEAVNLFNKSLTAFLKWIATDPHRYLFLTIYKKNYECINPEILNEILRTVETSNWNVRQSLDIRVD